MERVVGMDIVMPRAFSLFGLCCWLTACGTDWRYRDLDGDGWTIADGDCWDRVEGPEGSALTGLEIGPHAQEIWYDGIDQNCSGDDDFDADGDGWVTNPEHFLMVTAGVPLSGVHEGHGDCWDAPLDDIIPEEYVGLDGRILTPAEIHPGAEDTWYDGIDQDCMSDDDFDQDLDGYASAEHENRDGEVGDDCADQDDSISPEAEEICDEVDNDCDGWVDIEDDSVNLDDLPTWYADSDGDGFGDIDSGIVTCERPDEHVEEALATDCDDADAAIQPEADEVCDEIDNDCDELIDDQDDDLLTETGEVFYADSDGDGFGDPDQIQMACIQPSGFLTDSSDCDDGDAQVHPDATELCETVGVDDDCDGLTDENDAPDTVTFYADSDVDGYGDIDEPVEACAEPSGYIVDNTDCDDDNDAVHPGATETCNDIDDDCDERVDDEDDSLDTSTGSVWYADDDGDGYGDDETSIESCDAPEEYVSNNTDCDDRDDDISPDATEVCDSEDNDCDGDIDDADSNLDLTTGEVWFRDSDSDGYGDSDEDITACEEPSGYVSNGDDCDDLDSSISPDADEICDEVDNDCDDLIDDADASNDDSTGGTYFVDSDGDGYGDPDESVQSCEVFSGVVDNDGDCDDSDETIAPDADEICDGIDNDCDEDIDGDDSDVDVSTGNSFYLDADEDGYGSDGDSGTQACERPDGYADNALDCDDGDEDISPDADEVCNDGVDNDCDGTTGETAEGGICEVSDSSLEDANVLFTGSTASDVAGSAVHLLPDIDGDGVADVAIGAPYEDTGGSAAGAVYVYTGLESLDWDSQETWDLDSTNNFMVYGEEASDHAGISIAGGDIDGDGYGDLIVGAPHNDSGGVGAGIGYLFYGPMTGSGTISASTSDDSFEGSTGDFAAWSLTLSGDVDGDGCDDVLAGGPQNPIANSNAGSASGGGYAFLLPGAYWSACTGSGSAVLYYSSTTGDAAGYSLAFSDTDGDGSSEVLISAPLANLGGGNKSGAVYLSEGDESSSSMELGTDMVSYMGESNNDRAGWSVAGGGDVNDDGYEDILIGAYLEDEGASNGGAAYLILGPISVSETQVDLSAADAKITGTSSSDGAGYSVGFGGTLNDDDNDDLLIGVWKDDSGASNAGAAYVLFGPVSGSISLSDADARLTGGGGSDQAGTSLMGGQDVNDDGMDDVIVGGRYADEAGSNSGAAYLILGLGQ